MGTLGNMDGSFDGVLKASEQLKGLPKIIQKYMTAGIFQDELGWAKHFDDDSIDKLGGVDSFIAQIMNLDKAQQDALLSVSKFSDGLKEEIERLLQAARAGEKFNTQLFEQEASKDDKLSKGVLNEVMQTTGMKDADGNYLLTNTKDVCDLLEQYANDANNAQKAQELFNAGLLEQSDNGYKVSASLLKLIGAKKSDIVTTGIATAGQIAWNYAMQIGKQLLLSLGVAAVTFIATKLVDYIMNLKTHSEELVATMNDSHEAAQQATKDVEEIQSKIDKLNKSLKDVGVDKIEDIVDPAERERLQAINDMLQAQLELKKQLEKDANDKTNADTSAVVNDKTEDSIVKTRMVNVSYAEGGANAGTHQVAEKVSKTESLEEHTATLNDLIDKRRELATAGKENTQEYKDNQAAITSETEKIEELSSAVSENMNSYETNADSFAKYKGEYVAGTNAMTAATKALANANDDVGESASNYETLLQKMKAAKADVDNGDSERTDYRYMSAVDSLKRSGITTGDQILTLSHDSSKGTDQQKTAIAMLREEAAKAKLSIEDYVHGLEEMGEVSTTAALHTKELSTTISELDNIQSAYKTLTETTKEYNKSGYLTMDTLQSLLQLDPKYYNCLIDTDGQLKVNTQTIRTMTKARLADAKAEQLQLALDKMTTIKDLKSAKEYLGTATANAADAEEQFSAMYNQILTTDVRMHGPQYNAMKEALDQIKESYYSIAKLIDETGEAPLDKLFGTTDKTSKSTKQASSAIDAWSTLSSAMEEYNKQGSISLNTMKSLMGLEEKYTACLKKQGNELTIDATNFRNMIQTELKAAAETADASDKTKAKVSQYNKILKYLDENAKTGTISLNELRDAIEGVGTSLDKAQEKTSGLKSAFGTIHDILNTDNPAGALTSDNVEAVIDLVQEHKELKDILFDESGNLQINEESLKKATIALLENEKAATKDAAIQAILQKSINDLSSGVISITDYLKGLNTELDDIDSKLDKFQSGFNDINDIVDEYNKYGQLTQDSMQKFLRLDPQYLKCLKKEGDQLKFNAAQYRMLYAEQLHQSALSAKTNAQRKVYTTAISDIFGFTPEETEQYETALQNYADTVKEVQDSGAAKYGNVDNVNRGRIDWTKENLEKYSDFVAEQNELEPGAIVEGGYSTVLGASNAFWTGDGENEGEREIAYTPMLQTEDGVVPLTSNEIASYINDVIAKASQLEGGATAENILKIDAEGLFEGVAGEEIKVKNMIAGVEGQIVDDTKLTAADIAAIGGEIAENLEKYFGESSKYANQSMHDVQAKIFDSKETVDKLGDALTKIGIDGSDALSRLTAHFGDADKYAKNLEETLSNIKSLFSDLVGVFGQLNTDKSNDLKIQGDAWLEVIDKRIDALNEQNDAQERAIELSKAQDALEKAKANKTVHVYHAGGSGFEWEADQNAVRDAQSTLDDTIRKNRKEDEIERLNKLKKAVQENNELIGSSFEDYEKKKKYLAEFDKMTYDDMISYNENWKNSIIGNMKSTQVVTNINEIITKIEKLITTLETLNNVLTWIITLGKSTDGGGLTGLFSENGLFGMLGNFIDTAKTKGLETAAKETIGSFLDNTSAALEANADNPIVKAATGLWDKLKGIFSGKIVATGVEAGVDETLATLAKKEVVQKGAGNLLTRFGGAAAETGAATLTTGVSSIPVVGTLIAVAVNNAVQQFGKISKENTKIWANQNSTTGEKIVSSVGNVLYHLSPVEGWDKSVQYAKMAAEGEGLWQKLEYGAKSLYYATGLGVMLDNIWSTIKSILKVFGVKFKEGDDNTNPPSSVPDKKGIGSWKIWPWNWGKKAKGDKKIKKSAPYNVDEEGDEIIVRKPQTGRMTYLEKGDGVIPANETENLMTIGKNPLKWLIENVGKILGSSAAKDVVEGKVDEGAVTKASQVLASSVVNTFSSAWNSVKMSTEDLIDSMNDSFQGGSTSVTTAAGTILGRVKTMFGKFNLGKLLGSFSSGVSGAISKSAKEYSSTTELLSGTKSKTIDTMNKMRSTFESTWASVAKETGVSKDKITSISSEMFSKMETLVNQTYDAIDSNAGMSSDQLNDITKSLFQSMQSIYTSGWNAVYATSTGMSQETAASLNSAYKSSSDSCTQAMNTIRNTMVGSWGQCGGGVQNLANGTYQTLSKAWADSSGSAEKMLYDTRACFDSGWGAVEQGVSNLANNPKDKLSTAWAEITSQSNATFGAEGTLKTDADNAWKNVEPGATNLSKNMQWTMDQAYLATKQGCSDTVDSVNTNLNSTSASFSAIASAIDNVNKKASDSKTVAEETGHAWYEWVLNPVGTFADTVTKYNTEDKSKNNFLQNAVHTVTHPISSLVDNVKSLWKNITGHASGVKTASKDHFANVDEFGPELLVRKPQSGRYTYLETGDGVVPADITSKLFEMGGNPNKWFSEQMAKYGSQAITTKSAGNTSFSTGNIVINSPVGNSEDLASEIKKNFSIRMAQEWNKR